MLESTGRRFTLADNVLPSIGVIAPESARAAIRAAFLEHVIGGKGLSRGPEFAAMVQRGHSRRGARRGGGARRAARRRRAGRRRRRRDDRRLLRPAPAGRGRRPAPRTWSRRCGSRAPSRPTWACGGTPSGSSRLPPASTCRCPRGPREVCREGRRRPGAPARRPRRARPRPRPGPGRGDRRRPPARPALGSRCEPAPLADVAVVVGSGGVLRHADEDERAHGAGSRRRRPRRAAGRCRGPPRWSPTWHTCSLRWGCSAAATPTPRERWPAPSSRAPPPVSPTVRPSCCAPQPSSSG